MGSIEAYETVDGKRYRVRYRKPDNKQAAKRGFVTKKAATLYLARVEVSKGVGAYVDPSKAKMLVADWLDLWIEGRGDLLPTSLERTRGIIGTHIKPKLGGYTLGALDSEVLQGWAAALSKEGQGASSVRKIVHTLSSSLQTAVPNRLSSNPARGLSLPKVSKSTKRYLNHRQVVDIAASVNSLGKGMYGGQRNGYGLLVRVMAYCGPRWSEASGFRVKDVDFQRGRLEVAHTVVEVEGVQVHGVPKSYEARSLPVPASVLADLLVHVQGKDPESPLFPAARGGWLRNRVFRRGWLNEAAIAIDEEGLTPHEFRHTAASLAVSAGANVKAVQKMLGHASAAVTLDVYADLFEDDLDAVSVALDQAISKTIVSISCPLEPLAE